MAADDPGLGEAMADHPLLARMAAETAARPEHRELDRLVGRWEVRTQWEVVGGGGWQRHHGSAENRWILAGRVLESRSCDHHGAEVSRCYLAFDPSAGDYIAFSASVLSTYFVLERGTFDPLGPALVLEGSEPVPSMGQIRFRRTITFVDDERYALAVTYPDHPDGPFGRMFVEHRRTGP